MGELMDSHNVRSNEIVEKVLSPPLSIPEAGFRSDYSSFLHTPHQPAVKKKQGKKKKKEMK